MSENIIIWGTGKRAGNILKVEGVNQEEVLCFVDNNPQKWGKTFEGKPVIEPGKLAELDFDIIVIGSNAYHEIKDQIVEELNIATEKIKNSFYFNWKNFINYYDNMVLNQEEREILEYVRNGELAVFNYPFAFKYRTLDVEIMKDAESGLFFTDYKGKKMYFSRKLDTEEKVKTYYRNLMMEQDPESPHCYAAMTERITEGSVGVDAGVAEGNFALDIIDRVKKLYLIEPDPDWIEALRMTMRPYENKVVLVNKSLDSSNSSDTVTLDFLLESEEKIDFIKMDIEGSECEALKGAEKTLEREKMYVTVCAYHREGDEERIGNLLKVHGFECSVSRGYMVFILYSNFYGSPEPKKMVRGLIFGRK